MSVPPPAAAGAPVGPLLGREVWLACAGPFAGLPSVGDQVYYFPRGHADQCGGVQFLPYPPTDAAKPYIVSSVELRYHAVFGDPYAVISLQPDQEPAQPAAAPEHHDPSAMTYSVKHLDSAWGRSPFVVPKPCAESLLPPLVGKSQILRMVDVKGNGYDITHIIDGGRNRLSAGWIKFYDAQKFDTEEDAVVIMRHADGRLIVASRRGRPSIDLGRQLVHSVHEAVERAERDQSLTVTYYPRQGWPFVVPRKEVDDASALGVDWQAGKDVRMTIPVDAHELPSSRDRAPAYFDGVIRAVNQTHWCGLQVDWIGKSTPNINVNVWQVETLVEPSSKRLNTSDAPSSSKRVKSSDGPSSLATQSFTLRGDVIDPACKD